jgi:hypothetical protein
MSRSDIYLEQFEHPEELIPYKLGALAEFPDVCRSASETVSYVSNKHGILQVETGKFILVF